MDGSGGRGGGVRYLRGGSDEVVEYSSMHYSIHNTQYSMLNFQFSELLITNYAPDSVLAVGISSHKRLKLWANEYTHHYSQLTN